MDKCIIIGGGTFKKVACHLALATPAFGGTARRLKVIMDELATSGLENHLVLTKMADSRSALVTNEDLDNYLYSISLDKTVKAIIMNAALCDFSMENPTQLSRLSSQQDYKVELTGIKSKIVSELKKRRPDIFVVGFKTTHGDSVVQQCAKGFNLMYEGGVDVVLANDVGSYNNLLLTPDLKIHTGGRDELLYKLAGAVVDNIKEVQCSRYV